MDQAVNNPEWKRSESENLAIVLLGNNVHCDLWVLLKSLLWPCLLQLTTSRIGLTCSSWRMRTMTTVWAPPSTMRTRGVLGVVIPHSIHLYFTLIRFLIFKFTSYHFSRSFRLHSALVWRLFHFLMMWLMWLASCLPVFTWSAHLPCKSTLSFFGYSQWTAGTVSSLYTSNIILGYSQWTAESSWVGPNLG